MLKQLVIAATSVGVLVGCVAEPISLADDFGSAVRNNIVVHTINPAGVGDDDSQSIDGQTAVRAIESYRSGPEEASSRSLILNVGN
jgi:type IV pilus biogenesis protein CpaD/CtpE